MKFEKSRGQAIDKDKMVRVKRMNHIVEVVSIQSATNGLNKIQKLSKTHYVLKDTGEVKEYKMSKNRGQNMAGLKKSLRRIRDLINNNFTGKGNEIHLTLTYAENMTDPKRLYEDFKKFWKRYQYKYGNNCDYISVVEPQGRGAWHCHVLIRHNDVDKLYIPSEEIAGLWGHGFIKIRSLKGVDNIGAYLSAYLGDIELTEETLRTVKGRNGSLDKDAIKEVEENGKKKRYIKGGRLHLYPPGMNLYRKSKGIEFPKVERMRYGDVKKIVGTTTPNYTATVTILDDDKSRILNRVTYEHYNMKRIANKDQDMAQDMAQDLAKDLAQDQAQDQAQDLAKDLAQDPVLGSYAGSYTGSGTGPNIGSKTGPKTGSYIGSGTGSNTGPKTGPNTGSGTGPNAGSYTGSGTGPNAGSYTGSGKGPNIGSKTGPKTGSYIGSGTGSNTGS